MSDRYDFVVTRYAPKILHNLQTDTDLATTTTVEELDQRKTAFKREARYIKLIKLQT